MSSRPHRRTMAGLRWITGVSALVSAVVLADPHASEADEILLSCTAKRHVAVLDVDKVDKALADGDLRSSMSEGEAQTAITKLSATALKCFLKPGDKVRLANTSVVRDPIWLAFSGEDSSCMGVVFGKSAFECRSAR